MEESRHEKASDTKDYKTSMIEQVGIVWFNSFSFVFENCISSFLVVRSSHYTISCLDFVSGLAVYYLAISSKQYHLL